MNVILSNPTISEFLSAYPSEKHTNCLLGIILFGIYNLQSLHIDFSKILFQIESSEAKPTHSSFLARVQNSLKDDQSDTPRFIFEENPGKRFFSKLKEKRKPDKGNESGHIKTPSIVNPEIITEYATMEHSEVLRIADQFLNGQFVNEYCRSGRNGGSQVQQKDLVKSKKNLEMGEGSEGGKGRNSSSLGISGRRNSFSTVNGNRSIKGDRSTSYSKFW